MQQVGRQREANACKCMQRHACNGMHATACMQLNARNCMQLHAFSCMQLQQQFTRRWGPRTPQWAVGVSLAYFLIQKKK